MPPAARLRGGGRARGWSCRVSSRERPGRRPACLQAPGPGLAAAAQARAARPPLARASRLPGAAAGGQVLGPPRRRRRRRPARGREGGHRGGSWPGQAGEGAEGRSRAESGPPALGALETQIIRALEREAESGSKGRRRKSRTFIAFAPHLPEVAPHPPSPTTRSLDAAARATEAEGRAGAETTAPSLPRALPPEAPPSPRARPRAGALTTGPCCPSPTPPPAPPRRLRGLYSCGAAEQLERPGCC